MSARAISAPVIKQTLTGLLPCRVRAIEPDCIYGLNFDDARAAQAGHTQQESRDFVEAKLGDR
jgi:hypothetical protein